MLLMDKDSRLYSYYIDVSLDGKEYKRLFDRSKQYHRSWQFLHFQSRPVRFIKLVGTRIKKDMDSSKNRKGYILQFNNNPLQIYEYSSFEVVGLQAMNKTTNIPELVDGIIKPIKNVAKMEYGAIVDTGFGGNKMLNENPNEFTCHEIGAYIKLQLNQPYHIGSLRMLLGNNMNGSTNYSFCIETSMDEEVWEMAVDKREDYLSGWQEFNFKPRPANHIKITGTQKDVVSIGFLLCCGIEYFMQFLCFVLF